MTDLFRPPATRFRLQFESGAWAGAEIVCEGKLPTQLFLDMMAVYELGDSMTPDDLKSMTEAMGYFADRALVEWNFADEDGKPLPATREGFLSLGIEDCMFIITTWIGQAMTHGPLAQPDSASLTSSRNGTGNSPRRSSRKTAA